MGKRAGNTDEKENWLLIKQADDEAVPLDKYDILEQRPDPSSLPGAREGPLPKHIEPQLATLVSAVPQGKGWLHEIKYDGYRAFCPIENGGARFLTRRGKDWTDKFGKLPEAAAALQVKSALLDGEVVILLPDGTTSFQALQDALGKGKNQPIYFAFDLLYLDGYDLRPEPLIERKRALASLITDQTGLIRYSDHYEGEGEELYDQACRHGLEGVVSKRANGPYKPGRGTDWLKIKCLNRQEFVIGGFTDPAGTREGLGALLVGVYDNGKLRYCGKVGTGFTTGTLRQLSSRLERLLRSEPPFSNPPTSAKNVHWVKPELVAEVKFTGWTETACSATRHSRACAKISRLPRFTRKNRQSLRVRSRTSMRKRRSNSIA